MNKFMIGLCGLLLVGLFVAVNLVAVSGGGSPLWEMIWKVEQPVTGEVEMANLTTTTISWQGFCLNEPEGFGQEAIFVVKVDGLRRVNVWFDERGEPNPDVQTSLFWQVEIEGVLQDNELPAGFLEDSGISSSDVKGSHLRIVVWTESPDPWIGPLDIIVYAW
jgi:hypothetical protein